MLPVLASPYTPGAGISPPVLVGRAGFLKHVDSAVARAASGHGAMPPTVLHGQRGVGKTVLLDETRRRARTVGLLTAHVALARDGDSIARLALAVVEALRAEQETQLPERIVRELEDLGVAIRAGGFARLSPRWSQGDLIQSRELLQRLLLVAAEAARTVRGTGLVVTLDEVQDCPPPQLEALGDALQHVMDREASLVVVGAGLAHTPAILERTGTLAQCVRFIEVGRLEDEAAGLALIAPGLSRGVRWEQGASDLVVHEAGGSPYLIQLFGHHTWRNAGPTGRFLIEVAHARSGIINAHKALDAGMFRGRWMMATGAEQELLTGIARCMANDRTARMSEVAQSLGRTTPGLSSIRSRLLRKGLIESPRHDLVGFTMPGFERYILAQDEAGGALVDQA